MAPRSMLLATALTALGTAGCATADGVRYGDVVAVPSAYESTQAQRPMSIGEIVAELRSDRMQDDIADEIRERGLLAPVTQADVDLLVRLGANEDLVEAVTEASYDAQAAMGVAPPVYVTPPAVIHDYSFYPYAPYVPYGGFIYRDVPRFRGPVHRPPHDHRVRPDRHVRPDGRAPRPALPGAQSPRMSPGGGASSGGASSSGRFLPDADHWSNQQRQNPGASSNRAIPRDSPAQRQAPSNDPRLPRQ